jgi:Flp pilus assembly protein TadG
MRLTPTRSHYRYRRRGAATVEFCLIATFLLVPLLLGMFEFARAWMVKETLSDAAQKACRMGMLPARNSTDITNEVNDIMHDQLPSLSPSDYTVTILVNGAAADASTAQKGDQISVKVGVPVAKVAWTTTIFLTATTLESETVVMMRQG